MHAIHPIFVIYDLIKRSSYKPYLIALIFFLLNYSIWLCRYTSGWQVPGESGQIYFINNNFHDQ